MLDTRKTQKLCKFLPFLVLTLLALNFSVVFASDDYVFDHYDDSMNSYIYIKDVYKDAVDSNIDALGQSFKNTSSNGYLTSISVYMIKTGSPAGNLTCEVISIADLDSTPDSGTSVENSTVVDIASSITAIGGYVNFTFSGTWNFTADDWYCFIVWSDDATALDTSNYVGILRDTGDGHQGYSDAFGSTWSGSPVNDFQFIVYVNEDSSATPTPSPPPEDWYDDDYLALVGSYIVVLVIICIPAYLLGFTFKMGFVGAVVGLAIGSGLGYLLFPSLVPIWLVFLMGLGIVAMLLKGRM